MFLCNPRLSVYRVFFVTCMFVRCHVFCLSRVLFDISSDICGDTATAQQLTTIFGPPCPRLVSLYGNSQRSMGRSVRGQYLYTATHNDLWAALSEVSIFIRQLTTIYGSLCPRSVSLYGNSQLSMGRSFRGQYLYTATHNDLWAALTEVCGDPYLYKQRPLYYNKTV